MTHFHATLLAAACALALSACGDGSQNETGTTATTPASGETAGSTTPNDAGAGTTTPGAAGTTPGTGMDPGMTGTGTDGTAAAGTDGGATAGATTGTAAGAPGSDSAAAVSGCATEIEGNDRMQFSVNSITVPSSCSEFTITLRHTGQLPVAAMGHNVVITSEADMAGVAADGIAAGASSDYVKDDDDRVIAATEMVGGGETTSVTFSVDRIRNGSYQFFCSFPGHAALMKGTISVG